MDDEKDEIFIKKMHLKIDEDDEDYIDLEIIFKDEEGTYTISATYNKQVFSKEILDRVKGAIGKMGKDEARELWEVLVEQSRECKIESEEEQQDLFKLFPKNPGQTQPISIPSVPTFPHTPWVTTSGTSLRTKVEGENFEL